LPVLSPIGSFPGYFVNSTQTALDTSPRLRPFVGAKDYELSRDFYQALGWQLSFDTGDLAELTLNGSGFFLQRYYQADWCNNTMLHLTVDSADEWFDRASDLLSKDGRGDAWVRPPERQDYGARVTFLCDPSGVLWHLAEYDPS